MMLRYLPAAVLVVLTIITQVSFCWLIAFFVKHDGNFIWLFKWAQPYDTQAIGDKMFHDNEMKHTANWWWPVRNYWLALHWSGLRNPGYGMMGYLGIKVGTVSGYSETGQNVDIGDGGYTLGVARRFVINDGKEYFNYKQADQWNENYGWMVEFGWEIKNILGKNKGEICRLCVDVRPRIKLI